MSKRPGPETDHHNLKRHKTLYPENHDESNHDADDLSTQALVRLAEKADELVNCLQALKKQLSRGQTPQESPLIDTKKKLAQLSKHLLPSFEVLGSLDDNTNATQHSQSKEKPFNDRREISDVPIPSVTVTPWISAEIKRDWPPLPRILDPNLAEEAFTHPGLGRNYNYERLEWLGDAYLELISTALIHHTFGPLPSGRRSQLRERIVRNVNLAEYFRHYDMQKWAKLPREVSDSHGPGRGRSSDKDLTKTQADMFEAYVAAVVLSDPEDGLSNVVEWLKALWGKTLEEDIRRAEASRKRVPEPTTTSTDPVVETSAKERLSQRIVVKGIHLRYKDLPCEKKDKNLKLPLYSIGVYLDGWGEKDKLLGVGTALSKKEAGQKAADTVLQNKKLMKVYEEKKRAYMVARDAEMANE
ncbi:Ribonuclease 3-like protein [Cladobotryum mycophilum]|uniref:Ribonuclease 3-like protein n=1 Tax=Cladobotryum mycophilum TaxID=491253 RepID=A0ABR0SY76_9HYPO